MEVGMRFLVLLLLAPLVAQESPHAAIRTLVHLDATLDRLNAARESADLGSLAAIGGGADEARKAMVATVAAIDAQVAALGSQRVLLVASLRKVLPTTVVQVSFDEARKDRAAADVVPLVEKIEANARADKSAGGAQGALLASFLLAETWRAHSIELYDACEYEASTLMFERCCKKLGEVAASPVDVRGTEWATSLRALASFLVIEAQVHAACAAGQGGDEPAELARKGFATLQRRYPKELDGDGRRLVERAAAEIEKLPVRR